MLWIIAIYLSVCFGSTFQAPICMPTISEGSIGYPNIDGYVYFECVISTCPNLSKIVFEKTGLGPTWTPIYEGVNTTQYKALDTATEYTLENRNEYAAFRTKQALNIDPLILQDHGKWRCVVYDANFGKYYSGPLDFIIYVLPVDGAFYIKPNSSDLVINQQQEFTCVADNVYPEPDMFWEVNGVKNNGSLSMLQRENTFWFVNNTIQIRFDTLGINTLKCVILAEGRDPWLEKHINITLQEPASVLYPQHDILLTEEVDATFTLECIGSGYNPRIIWNRNGVIIHANDTNYHIKEECDYSKCDGSISSVSMDPALVCEDEDQYTGAYTCIIILEPPYQSSKVSSNMNVTMSKMHCKEDNIGKIVGFSMLSFVCVILVAVGVAFRLYKKNQKKHKGELRHAAEQGEQLLEMKLGERQLEQKIGELQHEVEQGEQLLEKKQGEMQHVIKRGRQLLEKKQGELQDAVRQVDVVVSNVDDIKVGDQIYHKLTSIRGIDFQHHSIVTDISLHGKNLIVIGRYASGLKRDVYVLRSGFNDGLHVIKRGLDYGLLYIRKFETYTNEEIRQRAEEQFTNGPGGPYHGIRNNCESLQLGVK